MTHHSLLSDRIRQDFPILGQSFHNKPLVYLDNAATTQKPVQVLEAMNGYYQTINSNIHRGVYAMSVEATRQYEAAREHVRSFINASRVEEIIFTRGTTESINLVAYSYGQKFLGPGDEVLITGMEHHSNIVPWQLACERTGASLKVVPLLPDASLDMASFESLLSPRVRLLAMTHVSNVTGIVNPIFDMISAAHAHDIPVLIDGAQAVAHMQVDVRDLDCDFYCFSGHKMYGPMGIGVLYGKYDLLNILPPWQGGGEMIDQVTFSRTTYNELPYKFEAGTPNVAEAIGLDAALNYVKSIGLQRIHAHEQSLLAYLKQEMEVIGGFHFIGHHPGNSAVLSFLTEGIHFYDMGTILDKYGIAVRTGNHCAQPLMDALGINGTMRVSFGLYNQKEEIDSLLDALRRARALFL